ncbi:hypothetical protein C8R44DRAFT_976115 [Mycena epipterygia]|nr:hypothetical protein C8R44DRAFT_976115 [Mycena epipterygia]
MMLSVLRLRALPLLRLAPRVPKILLRAPLRAISSTPRILYHKVCLNCRNEGHNTADCKEPMICVACGVEGHLPRDCPKPDLARLEALLKPLQTAPTRWTISSPASSPASRVPVVRPTSPASHSSHRRSRLSPPSLFECSYRCGEEGHGVGDCPHPPTCFRCGQPDHMMKDCPIPFRWCVPFSVPPPSLTLVGFFSSLNPAPAVARRATGSETALTRRRGSTTDSRTTWWQTPPRPSGGPPDERLPHALPVPPLWRGGPRGQRVPPAGNVLPLRTDGSRNERLPHPVGPATGSTARSVRVAAATKILNASPLA